MYRSLKQFAFATALIALSAAHSIAAPVACPDSPPPALTVDTYPTSGSSSFSYSCAGMTFSNFEVVPASGNLTFGQIDLTAAYQDDGEVILTFNPNLQNPSFNMAVDLYMYYMVTGSNLSGIDLAVRGSNSAITESACSSGIDRVNGNICVGGKLGELAVITNFSGEARADMMFPNPVNSYWVFKDINVGPRGELTSFSQSHHSSPIPEPGTWALISSALPAIWFVRRKRARQN